ncbi:MAG: hypothetical protein OXE17_00190 [Chloroflexi bacterium]|nr:hypothetical protein [Chloroflexota bacterium]
MSDPHVEKVVHEVLRRAQASCGRPAQGEAAIRCAVVDGIPPSLGRRAWLPWEPQPGLALGRHRRSGNALFDPSGGPAVLIQERPLAQRPAFCRPARGTADPGARCAEQRGTGCGWTLPMAGQGPVVVSWFSNTAAPGPGRGAPKA